MSLPSVIPLPLLTAPLTAVLILLLLPVPRRYPPARSNARWSHPVPKLQDGGTAIIDATVIVGVALLVAETQALPSAEAEVLMLSSAALASVGGRDDVRPPLRRFNTPPGGSGSVSDENKGTTS